jgi:hypothetical protein
MDPLGDEEGKGRANRQKKQPGDGSLGGGGMGRFCNCVHVTEEMVYSVFMSTNGQCQC